MAPALRYIWYVAILSVAASISTAQSASDTNLQAEDKPASDNIRQEESWKLTRGAVELGVEAGYAPMQPTFFSGRKEYDTSGRKFAYASLKFGRVIGTRRGVTYEYLFDVTPLALAINNEVSNKHPDEYPLSKTIRGNTYGFAIQPAGFRFLFTPEKRLKPYFETSAGFIFTNQPIPVPQGLTYNFAGNFGGGMMYSLTPRNVLKAGYRYYHISNMNIGKINPGYNANMLYFDMTVFSK